MAAERRLMRTYARKTSIIVLLGVALTGCTSAEWNSIHRSHQLGDDQIRTLISDAKQRIVLTKNRAEVTNVDGSTIERVVCAEPSPDVAQAVSSSISAAFEKTGAGGQGLSVNAAAKFGESVAQLGERMAVIQLIRDKMYRACEAYANGAVDKAAYTLMLARLDKTMVTLLSQEMAAGAFGRALAVAYSSPGGADPAAIDKLKAKVDTAIDGIGVKEDEQAAQKTSAKAAATELSGAAKAGVGGGASGSGGGSIGNRPSGSDLATAGKTIHAIYRDYVDDDGTEPLVDACLVTVSTLKISAIPEETDEIKEAKDTAQNARALSEFVTKKGKFDPSTKSAFIDLYPWLTDSTKKIIGSNSILKTNDLTTLTVEQLDEKIADLPREQKEEIKDKAEEVAKKAESDLKDAENARNERLINLAAKENIFGAYCLSTVLKFGTNNYIDARIDSEQQMRLMEKTASLDEIKKSLEGIVTSHKEMKEALEKVQTCIKGENNDLCPKEAE